MRFHLILTLLFLALAPSALADEAHWYGASNDGSKVIFETPDALATPDQDFRTDVYRYSNGQTELISGGSAMEGASWAGNSADGTRIFFTTREKLVASDTDTSIDVYRWTEGAGISLVSIGVGGGNGAFDARFEGSTPDGQRAYISTVEPLVPSDTDQKRDVFQVAGNGIGQISTGPAGGNGPQDAAFDGVNADGTKVFFSTVEPLVATDTDTEFDAYERSGGATTLVSTGAAGGNGPHQADFEAASADGTRVLFRTAEALTVGDTDTATDIYVRQGGSTALMTPSTNAAANAEDVSFTGTDATATRLVFATDEKLLAGDTDSVRDVYERYNGGYTKLTYGSGAFGVYNQAITPDATAIVFATSEALVGADQDTATDLYRRVAGQTTLVTPHTASPKSYGSVFISNDASRVAWDTEERHLASDTDTAVDVYLWDAGTVSLVSQDAGGPVNSSVGSYLVGMSADGTRAWFETDDALAPEDKDKGYTDVYERSAGQTKLVSIDNQPPETTVTGLPAELMPNTVFQLDFSTDDPADDFKCTIDGGAPVLCYDDSKFGPFGAGEHVITAYAIDDTGNADPTPAEIKFTVQPFPPATPSPQPADAPQQEAPSTEPTQPQTEPQTQPQTQTDTPTQTQTQSASEPAATEPQSPADGSQPPVADSTPARDATRPALSAVSAKPSRFFLGGQAARRHRTVLRWTVSEAARVTFTVKRRVRAHGRTRWVRVGSFAQDSKPGANKRRFGARLGRRTLRVGRYRVVLQAQDAAGNRSARASIRLRIAR